MSLQRFFLEHQVFAHETGAVFSLHLTPDDLKHFRVLRMNVGEHFAVIDASMDYFECELVSVVNDYPQVKITQHSDAPADRPCVMLVQGLAKGDKMDTIIRHATELGVSSFVPFAAERSIVKLDDKKAAKRRERWQSIAKSAAMQSGQPSIPQVYPLSSLDTICSELATATSVFICWEEAPRGSSLASALRSSMAHCGVTRSADARVAVIVGPEGGLTKAEVDAFLASNERASIVSLGASILRTETAGIVAPALVLYELGELGASGMRGYE